MTSWAKASVNPLHCSEFYSLSYSKGFKSLPTEDHLFSCYSTPASPVTRLDWMSEKLMGIQGFPIIPWSTVSPKEQDLCLSGGFSSVFTSPLGYRHWVLLWLTPWDVVSQRLTRWKEQVRPCLYSILTDFSTKRCKEPHTIAALPLFEVAKVVNLAFLYPGIGKKIQWGFLYCFLCSEVLSNCIAQT